MTHRSRLARERALLGHAPAGPVPNMQRARGPELANAEDIVAKIMAMGAPLESRAGNHATRHRWKQWDHDGRVLRTDPSSISFTVAHTRNIIARLNELIEIIEPSPNAGLENSPWVSVNMTDSRPPAPDPEEAYVPTYSLDDFFPKPDDDTGFDMSRLQTILKPVAGEPETTAASRADLEEHLARPTDESDSDILYDP